MTREALRERLVAGRCRAAKVPRRDGFALQKGRSVHTADLGLRAWRRNRQKHVKQGLAGGAARALDREQPPLGDAAAVGRYLVGVAAGFEHPMAGNDDHERVAGDRLRDRAHGARSPDTRGNFAIGAGFAARNRPRERVNPRIEVGYAAEVERDPGEIGAFAAQQRRNTIDRHFDMQRGSKFAGIGIETKQAPPCFDLARFRQLHADDAAIAPCDAASADCRIENGVPTPRHHATHRSGIIALSWTGAS